MNYAGPFGSDLAQDASVSLTDRHFKLDSASLSHGHDPAAHDSIVVPDANLLFSSDFSRLGDDLILTNANRKFVVSDYFHGEKRAFLTTPDGASLSGEVVDALTGHVQYAQAGPVPAAARDIGQVSKLVGTATVIRNGVVVELHNGDHVFKGDVVQAGVNSSCTITFVDGSVFGLSANARMLLNDMVYDQAGASNSALISLVRGTISFVAGETAKHGDMKVETPVATMGIRGTAVLVEIGFEIPSDGKSPPVNFQVLVEPDGTTGSYIVYSKSDPSVILGTVNKAGQVYSVSGDGTFSNLPSTEMSQVAAAIIQQVFAQRFPSYVPTTPQSGGGAGSTPPTPPGNDIPQHHDDPGNGGNPTTIPITINVPDGNGGTKTTTVPVGVSVVDVAPTVTDANVNVFKGGTTLLNVANFTIADPDSTSFTFIITATNGHFEINTTDNTWVRTDTFTSADLAAGHVRFVSVSECPPIITVVVSDGKLSSPPFDVHVNFDESSNLNSTAGLSIDLSTTDGATEGFTFPHAGNVTTPGTPEDRIVLGYHTPDSATHVLNNDPMLNTQDFTPISSTPGSEGGVNSVATTLGAGNNVTLTQTISLGENAEYFTTTIDVHNGGTSAITGVRFLRNFDPDQDIQVGGGYATYNDVVWQPTTAEPFAIISARGQRSDVTVSMIGIGMAWHASVYNFTNIDPYADNAYNHPVDPNGALADLSLTLTYDFGTIAAGTTQHISFITTDNVATDGDNALFGTTGNDTINGYGGNDLLIGLSGADTFVFTKGFGHDTVLDFHHSDGDQIDLSAVSDIYSVYNLADVLSHAQQDGSDTLISFGDAASIRLSNVSMTSLQSDDFVFGQPPNQVPVAHDDVLAASQDHVLTVSASTLLANDTDADPDDHLAIFPASLTSAHGASVTITGSQVVYDPTHATDLLALNAGDTLTDTFTYTVQDDHGHTSTATVSVTVAGVNDAPVISTDGLSLSGGGSASSPVTILGLTVSDPDSGDTFTLSTTHNSTGSSTSPVTSSGDLTAINSTLSSGISYDPGSSPQQTDSVTVTVTDAHNATDTVNFIFNQAGNGPSVSLEGTTQKDVFFATGYQDTFVFAPNSNNDTIIDFTAGVDKIDVQQIDGIDSANVANLFALDGHGNTIVNLDPANPTDHHNTILLKGVTHLTANDFIIHPGTSA